MKITNWMSGMSSFEKRHFRLIADTLNEDAASIPLRNDKINSFLIKCFNMGRFDIVLDGKEHIDMFSPVEDFNGLSLHEWLLINPQTEYFELWKNLRRVLNKARNKEYNSGFGDSAALIMYANLPERLEHLRDSDWRWGCNPHRLYKAGFEIKDDSTKKRRSLKTYTIKFKLNALDIACFYGSKRLIERCVLAEKNIAKGYFFLPYQWDESKILESLKCYMMFNKYLSIEPLVDILNETNLWFYKDDKSFFTMAFDYYNTDKLRELWNSMDVKAKNKFIKVPEGLYSVINKCLIKEKSDLFDFIFSLENEESLEKSNISINSMIDDYFIYCVFNNKIKSVNFLLDIDASLLNRKIDFFLPNKISIRYTEGKSREEIMGDHLSIGSALTVAVIRGYEEMVDVLLEKGASTKHCEYLLNCLKQGTYKKIQNKKSVPLLEKLLLKETVMNNTEMDKKSHCYMVL